MLSRRTKYIRSYDNAHPGPELSSTQVAYRDAVGNWGLTQYAAAALFVVSALGEGYALYEIWQQSRRANAMLLDPTFRHRVGFDGGKLDDADAGIIQRNAPENQSVVALAKNQQATGRAMVSLLVGLVAGVAGNFLTM